jgi:hypothetical protein
MQRCKSKFNYIFKTHTKINSILEILGQIEATSMKSNYCNYYIVNLSSYFGGNQTKIGVY